MSLSPNLDPPQGNFLSGNREVRGGGRERLRERKRKWERTDNKNQVNLRKKDRKEKKEIADKKIPGQTAG
jgi:hypothetical protein